MFIHSLVALLAFIALCVAVAAFRKASTPHHRLLKDALNRIQTLEIDQADRQNELQKVLTVTKRIENRERMRDTRASATGSTPTEPEPIAADKADAAAWKKRVRERMGIAVTQNIHPSKVDRS